MNVSNAQLQKEATDILKKVRERYQSLRSYRFETVQIIESKNPGMQNRVEMPMKVAYRAPYEHRSELSYPMMGISVSVSNGKYEWEYDSRMNEYTKKPITLDDTESGSGFASFFGEYLTPDEELTGARIVGVDTVNVGKGKRDCVLLELAYRDSAASPDTTMKMHRSPKALWIDRERLIVLRDSQFSTMKSSFFPVEMAMSMIKIFNVADIDTTIPDSLFVFNPPPGAKEVEEIERPEMKEMSLKGKAAEDFTLKDLEGREFNLKDNKGRVVLIDFWASWCSPCKKELPSIERMYNKFKDKGVVIVGVNDEPVTTIRAFVKNNGYSFPTLVDEGSKVSQLYQVRSIPTVIVIDKDGIISTHFIGGRTESDLLSALKKIGIE